MTSARALYFVLLFAACGWGCGHKDDLPPEPGGGFGTEIVFTGDDSFVTGISIVFEGDVAYFSTFNSMYIASCGKVENLRHIDIYNIPDVDHTRETIRENYGYITSRPTGYHAYYISKIDYDTAGDVSSVVCYYSGFTPGKGWY